MKPAARVTIVSLAVAAAACSGPVEQELRHLPVRDLEGVVTMPGDGVVLDMETTTDRDGSLRMHAEGPSQVFLYELDDVDVDDSVLVYRANVKTKDVRGKAYLEMYLTFPGRGTFFSQSDAMAQSGTSDWTTQETRFLLKEGENPSRVQLNLVIDGTGVVWVDDIHLAAAK